MKKNTKSDGFSLVEVLVFVSVVALFFVTAALISSFSLRISKSNETKILGTRYAEELLEWLRGEKEADWEAFTDRITCYPTVPCSENWCFDETPIANTDGWQTRASCQTYDLQNTFKRDLVLSTTSDPNQINVVINVSWLEGDSEVTIPIKTVFSRFE